MKRCPYCAEEIQDEAIKCRFCGEMTDGSQARAGASDALRMYLALGAVFIIALVLLGMFAFGRSPEALNETTASLRPGSSAVIDDLKVSGAIQPKTVNVKGLSLQRACADTKTSTYDVMVCNDNAELNQSEGAALEAFLTRAAEREMTQKKADQHYKNFLKRRSEVCPINPFKDMDETESNILRDCLIDYYKTL